MPQMRDVCLPLEKLDKCNTCNGRSNLRLCSKCGEGIYCSKQCQEKDWPRHKRTCRMVDRIDLAVMYPFLASLAEIGHCWQWKPLHPALTHQISTFTFRPPIPKGECIFLRNEITEDEFTLKRWWPESRTDSVRRRLFHRILHENYILPVLMSISMALLAGIYTTRQPRTSSRQVRRNVRLTHRGSPISDFGIAKGSIKVEDKNRLFYLKESLYNVVVQDQDPGEHYWLYFKTIREEEAIVDLAASLFNVGSQVKLDPYIPGKFPSGSFAPALFEEGNVTENVIGAHRERDRFSVLRNEDLHIIARHATAYRVTLAETDLMWEFMEDIAEEECEEVEKLITIELFQAALLQVESTVKEAVWKQWPLTPECRPCSDETESEEWWKELMKWRGNNKLYKRQDLFSLMRGWNYMSFAGIEMFGGVPFY